MSHTYVYKIKRKDEMFSTGGLHPSFHKNGKIWKSWKNLMSHLRMIEAHTAYCKSTQDWCYENKLYLQQKIYEDCEVIQYETVISEAGSVTKGRGVWSILCKDKQT